MSFSLPVNLIRQHLFCPRIPYFQELLQLRTKKPIWVGQGEGLHRNQERKFKYRTLERFHLENAEQQFNIKIGSTELALHGVLDSLLLSGTNVYPIEFKLAGRKPTIGHILQLTAYAMLAEYQFERPSTKGFVLYGEQGKTHPVVINDDRKKQVEFVRDAVRKNLEGGVLPDSSATSIQCGQCEFLNFCNDRY